MRLISLMGRLRGRLARIRCLLQVLAFVLDGFVDFLDAKAEFIHSLIEDTARAICVRCLIDLNGECGVNRFALVVFTP